MGIHNTLSECSGLHFFSQVYFSPPWQPAPLLRRESWASWGKRAWGQMTAFRLVQPSMFLCLMSGLAGSCVASMEGPDTTANTGTRFTTSAGAVTRILTALAEMTLP